jgi:hypothetical protein
MMGNTRKLITVVIASAALSTGSSSAALLIYEPFAYADTGPINDNAYLGDGNQSGALGTTGTWSQLDGAGNGTGGPQPLNEIDVRAAGLTFTDGGSNVLPVTGGNITRDNRVGQNAAWISVTSSATTGLTADASTMWMTFLFQDKGFSGPDSFLGLTSQTVTATDAQNLSAAGFGVGIGVNSIGGPARAIGASVYNNATGQTFTPEGTATFDGPGSSTVHLLAMKVNWNAFGTPDQLFVFDITDLTTEPAEGTAIASTTFDWTQSEQNSLTLLSIGDTQIENFDELRFATTFAEAVGVPEPSAALLGALSGLLVLRRRRR